MSWKVGAVAAFAFIISGCDDAAVRESIKRDLCEQSAEAAHYIAAKSVGGDDVRRVVGDVIAERKYPDLRDKDVAAIGGIVILSEDADMSPSEIEAKMHETCMAGSAG